VTTRYDTPSAPPSSPLGPGGRPQPALEHGSVNYGCRGEHMDRNRAALCRYMGICISDVAVNVSWSGRGAGLATCWL